MPVGDVQPALVGEWYLNSRSAHRDGEVIGAYRQLEAETDRLFSIVTRAVGPGATRIVFTRCRQPYGSCEEMMAGVRTCRTLEVTVADSSGERLHPLLDCGFGGAFDRFRAVHDLIGHAWDGNGFECRAEYNAWKAQARLHSDLAGLALATELYGVNAARGIIGQPPELRALLFAPSVFAPSD
jgi:hypothetical protein